MNEMDELDRPLAPLWHTRLILASNGKDIDKRSQTNGFLYITYHPDMAGKLVYDEFADKSMFVAPPPWDENESFRVRKIDDNDCFMCSMWLENLGLKLPKNIVADAMFSAAKQNRTNPAKRYFGNIKEIWDGTPRLDSWLTYYLGAESQPAEYLSAVGKKWMIAVVGRTFHPGMKFDHMLILEGAQGIGKSSVLRELATFGDEVFFYDGRVSFHDKDTLMALQGKIIVEMAELASMRKVENEEIKAFITRTQDEYRTPYSRSIGERPRYYVLTGSTNETEYLPPDDSGHRRYWPVQCGKIDIEAIRCDREQLWAEAVTLYMAKTPTWVLPEEVELFKSEQEKRVIRDAWHEIISKYLIQTTSASLTIDEVFEHLSIQPKDRNNLGRKRIKDTMKNCGWHETRNTQGVRVWTPKIG